MITKSKYFTRLLCPAMFIFAISFWPYSSRLTAMVLLIGLGISYFHFLRTSRFVLMRWLFVAFLIAVFLPIDVTLQNHPGPPRFVPYLMGLRDPTAAEKDEAMFGGCMVRGTEPRWVLVW